MGLRLILGSSGSGKTYNLYKTLLEVSEQYNQECRKKCFAVVPEQYTMETQKTIVQMSPGHGTMNIDILSFNRLAIRVFDKTGVKTGDILDDTGKSMILRKVMEQQRDNLCVFGKKVSYPGFVEKIKSIISELYQYGISTDELEQIIDKSSARPLLQSKIKDIKTIEQNFEQFLKDRFITSEQLMELLYEQVPFSEEIHNSIVTFDGFTGFTALQYKVIEQLVKIADVYITVTIQPEQLLESGNGSSDVFALSKKTISKLERIALDNNIKTERIILDSAVPYRVRENEELKWLEKNLFSYNNLCYDKSNDNIRLHESANPEKECNYIASKISSLVKKHGYRYSDIAVITGNIEEYSYNMEQAFRCYEIPCFIDCKRGINNNPFIETIKSLLHTIDMNYSYENMFRFLRCNMVGMSMNEVDLLENYVIANGIGSYKRWSAVWEDADTKIIELKNYLMDILSPLYNVMKKQKPNVRDMTRALYDFISGQKMQEQLLEYEKMFEEEGNLNKAKEYSQIYARVMEMFDKTVNLLGEEKLSVKDYTAIMESGFEEIKVGIIPSTIDRVVVGDIERTRLGDIKILFFAGVNDGIIPGKSESTGILSETDRNYLEECDVELSPTARENLFIQKFYLYINMTRTSEKLWLTYSRSTASGSPVRPSYLIMNINNRFNKLKVESDITSRSMEEISSKKMLEKTAAIGLREIIASNIEMSNDWKEIYKHVDDSTKDKILRAAFYRNSNDNLEKAVANALYGKTLKGSVSRLETYAACAYRHFIMYGLNITSRKEFEVGYADAGNIYHSALECFSKQLLRNGMDWRKIDDTVRSELVTKSVDEALKNYTGKAIMSTARNQYMLKRMYDITDRTVWALCNQLKKGEFIPNGFEVRFESDDMRDKMQFELSESERMNLRGTIDRIDIFENDDDIYVKIIDYKSGNKKFDIYDVYNGLQMQLVLYMEAAIDIISKGVKDKKVVPAGIFYYDIVNPVIEESGEDWQETLLGSMKPNGLVNEDMTVLKAMDNEAKGKSKVIPVTFTKNGVDKRSSAVSEDKLNKLMKYVHMKTEIFGEEIVSGEIKKNPYIKESISPCSYCEYKSVCKFDLQLPGSEYRRFEKQKPEDVWNKITEYAEKREEK